MLLYVLKFLWDVLVLHFIAFIQVIWKPSKKSIHGEIALVTGAGHGMGRLLAMKIAGVGATVVVVDINEDSSKETIEMIQDIGGVGHAYTCDLRMADDVERLGKVIRKEVGDVTILVNNAGVIQCADILSFTDDMISDTFNVNIKSHFWLIKEFLPQMKRRNHGHIIALASAAGLLGAPFMTSYSASKHAVVGLMDSLRLELRKQEKHGVKTTIICPAFVDTGFVKNPRIFMNNLFSVLKPEHVVDVAMDGILRDQHMITVPSYTPLQLMRSFVPVDVFFRFLEFLGAECDRTKC